jgi:hypothetical protein
MAQYTVCLEPIPNNTLHQSLLTKTTDYETKPTQGEDATPAAPYAGVAPAGIFAKNQLYGQWHRAGL